MGVQPSIGTDRLKHLHRRLRTIFQGKGGDLRAGQQDRGRLEPVAEYEGR